METRGNGPSPTPEGQKNDIVDVPRQNNSSELLGSGTRSRRASSTEPRPALPPRPGTIDLLDEDSDVRPSTARPNLQSQATTALSLDDISGQTNSDAKNVITSGIGRSFLGRTLRAKASLSQLTSARGSETGDTASIRSYIPNAEESQEESIFGDFVLTDPAREQQGKIEILSLPEFPQDDGETDFVTEFDPVGELADDGHNEGKSIANLATVEI